MKSFSNSSLSNYLKSLASTQPAPGGGSAAAVVAALGFSLLEKVAAISQTKQKASFQNEIQESKLLEKIAMKLADGDAKAYGAVIKAYKIKAVTEK